LCHTYNNLVFGGYPKSMSCFVEAIANAEENEAPDAAAAFATEQSNKRKFAEMPSVSMRLNIVGIIDGHIDVVELHYF
jgi:hypothetical protein